MALLRTKEIRAMDTAAREKKLRELRDELMHERGVAAMGGAPPNPGKIRALRKNIARLHTVQSQEGGASLVAASTAPVGAPEPGKPKPAEKEPKEPEESEEEGEEADEETEEDKP